LLFNNKDLIFSGFIPSSWILVLVSDNDISFFWFYSKLWNFLKNTWIRIMSAFSFGFIPRSKIFVILSKGLPLIFKISSHQRALDFFWNIYNSNSTSRMHHTFPFVSDWLQYFNITWRKIIMIHSWLRTFFVPGLVSVFVINSESVHRFGKRDEPPPRTIFISLFSNRWQIQLIYILLHVEQLFQILLSWRE